MSFNATTTPQHHSFTLKETESILEGALRQGVGLPYGCRNGYCGSCKGKVITGHIRYPDGVPPGLSPQEAAHGYALFCQAHPLSDLTLEVNEVATATDLPIKTLPVRVAKMTRLAPDVMQLLLQLPATERLQYLAGQYLNVLLKDGKHRSFSLANPPHQDEFLELHIRQVPGGSFTTYIFEQLQEKALLRIRAPLGTFFLREDSRKPIIFVGGGTGFAPLKGMIEHALHIGLARPMHLFWGVRTQHDLYSNLPYQWAKRYDHYHFRYTPVLSEPETTANNPLGEGKVSGWVHQAVIDQHPDLSAYQIYMAGPPAMITAAKTAFFQHGLPETELFYDSFEFMP